MRRLRMALSCALLVSLVGLVVCACLFVRRFTAVISALPAEIQATRAALVGDRVYSARWRPGWQSVRAEPAARRDSSKHDDPGDGRRERRSDPGRLHGNAASIRVRLNHAYRVLNRRGRGPHVGFDGPQDGGKQRGRECPMWPKLRGVSVDQLET